MCPAVPGGLVCRQVPGTGSIVPEAGGTVYFLRMQCRAPGDDRQALLEKVQR